MRPFVGVRYIPVTDEVQATYKLPIDYGVLVSKGSKDNPGVLPGSPAEGAGIKEGDIITEIDGKSINKDEDFALIIRNKKVGDTISIKILRDGKEIMIYLVLGQAN